MVGSTYLRHVKVKKIKGDMMAFDQNTRNENERDKFVEDADGNTAVRVVVVV